jgi:hypothetical protein
MERTDTITVRLFVFSGRPDPEWQYNPWLSMSEGRSIRER